MADVSELLQKAKTLAYENRYEEVRQVVKLQPDFANAWNMLGLGFFQQNKMEEAELCLLKALELEPENEYAKKNLNAVCSHR